MGNRRTERQDNIFFNELARSLRPAMSAKAAGYSRSAVYEYKLSDDDFAELWEDARQEYIESLEEEADKRATNEKKPSDVLLIFRLKALAPEKYRERQDIKHGIKPNSGVMVVPGIASIGDWNEQSVAQQSKLKKDVRD